MGEAATPVELELVRRIRELERRLDQVERMPSGRNSVGIAHIRPAVKAGTPSDSDYAAVGTPPVGATVYDTSASRLWVRHSSGVWKYVTVT